MSVKLKNVELPGFIDDRAMGWYQIHVAIICGLVMFLEGFDTQMMAYVVPSLGKVWGLDNETLGALFSASLVGVMIGYLVVAPYADRAGHKRMIIMLFLGTSIAIPASAFTANVNELMVVRFVTGIGFGGLIPSVIVLTSEYSPKRIRATIVLAIYTGYSLGAIVAGLVSGWVIPIYGWTIMFLIGGAMRLVLLPVIFFFLPDSVMLQIRKGKNLERARKTLRRIDPQLPHNFPMVVSNTVGEYSMVVRIPVMAILSPSLIVGTILLWIIFSVNLGEFYALQSWLPSIIEKQGYSIAMLVKCTTSAAVGGIMAAFIAGPFMDRMNPYNVLAALYLFGFLSLLVFGFSFQSVPWVILLASFFVGFCVSGGQKCANVILTIFYPPDIRGTGVGWALGVGRVGAISGPLIIGKYINPDWPPTTIFGYMAVPMLFLSGAIFFLGKFYRRKKIMLSLRNTS